MMLTFSARTFLFRALRHLLLMAGALVFLAPFIWMVLTSLKPVDEVFTRELTLLPTRLALVENYTEALTRVPLLRYLWNGLLVCTAILVLQIVVLLPAAYAFAKLQFRGKTWAWRLVLLALMIPHQATAIPTYVMLHHLGMLNTLSALIVPFSISAFGIFLMRQFFRTVPDDLVHAARLDGMSEFELVWRVMLPTAVPALFAFAIFSVVWHWNDYFWPLLVISSPELATPPLGTMFFRNEEAGINYGRLAGVARAVGRETHAGGFGAARIHGRVTNEQHLRGRHIELLQHAQQRVGRRLGPRSITQPDHGVETDVEPGAGQQGLNGRPVAVAAQAKQQALRLEFRQQGRHTGVRRGLGQPVLRITGEVAGLQGAGLLGRSRLGLQCQRVLEHRPQPLAERRPQPVRRHRAQPGFGQHLVGRCGQRRQGVEQRAIDIEDDCSDMIVSVHIDHVMNRMCHFDDSA